MGKKFTCKNEAQKKAIRRSYALRAELEDVATKEKLFSFKGLLSIFKKNKDNKNIAKTKKFTRKKKYDKPVINREEWNDIPSGTYELSNEDYDLMMSELYDDYYGDIYDEYYNDYYDENNYNDDEYDGFYEDYLDNMIDNEVPDDYYYDYEQDQWIEDYEGFVDVDF